MNNKYYAIMNTEPGKAWDCIGISATRERAEELMNEWRGWFLDNLEWKIEEFEFDECWA